MMSRISIRLFRNHQIKSCGQQEFAEELIKSLAACLRRSNRNGRRYREPVDSVRVVEADYDSWGNACSKQIEVTCFGHLNRGNTLHHAWRIALKCVDGGSVLRLLAFVSLPENMQYWTRENLPFFNGTIEVPDCLTRLATKLADFDIQLDV